MPLTDTAVRQAKPAEKDVTLTDGSGLSLFIATNGTKSWHFRFSWHGKQPRMSLGTYPEISLKDARELRDQARVLVAKGTDPRSARREEKRAASSSAIKTFEVVANEWYAFKRPRWDNAKKGAAVQAQLYLDKDLVPALGRIPVADVKRADVLACLRVIEKRGALNVARKCRTWLNEIFRYGIASDYLEVNPAADLDIVAAKEPPEKHNPMLRQHELKEFLQALEGADIKNYTKSAIRILLLTAVRTGELRQATWSQFDLDAGLWTVPAEGVKQLKKVIRAKGGDKVPPYLVPLSRQAVEEVRKVHQMTGRYKLLIAGRSDPSKPISDGTVNVALRRMGFEGRLTGHGIRATISTALNEMGYNEDWIEAQLSHASSSKVRKTYNHAEYVEQRRVMMQEWADYLDAVASAD
ncbi:MAG: tyrosine-type recombinase/integrase [Gammaproteobacteria bacterium]|nr:tyrosine-type recombinase/integrase [Gammaproteobacteria bacterium]MBU0821855.1 tyrosine-type recombinase/integrase [Gammaproteobacteria bacterium]MBU0843968.1 tyrosine-type recombinase/integrase [Gammaproteobacteria bacterium]MBU1842219.1 tyrosine-type recombinase/integrase [Gammaproteobacteria bacterium]